MRLPEDSLKTKCKQVKREPINLEMQLEWLATYSRQNH